MKDSQQLREIISSPSKEFCVYKKVFTKKKPDILRNES
jgi:hypothetical protein